MGAGSSGGISMHDRHGIGAFWQERAQGTEDVMVTQRYGLCGTVLQTGARFLSLHRCMQRKGGQRPVKAGYPDQRCRPL